MTATAMAAPVVARELGTWDCGRPGPTLLVLAGIHGNEPGGVAAARAVLAKLTERELPLCGRVVALAGNLPALAAGRRFVARDLNRGWSAASIAALRSRPAAERSAEDGQQFELLQRFEAVLHDASGPVVFVDLHTSSADGPPFSCLADTLDNRRIGLAAGVPTLLGIEETLDGASLEWFGDRGVAALAVEGGRHEHPDTVGNLTAVLWLLLERLGMLPKGLVDIAPHREHLARAVAGVPPVVEIVRRHAITAEDGFRMEPGFVNFAPARKGLLLAHDRRGEVRAPFACRVLLPLYQALGDDGFFLGRPVAAARSLLARVLRGLRCDAVVHWLPGVRRDPADPLTILVDPRIARWAVVGLFHLLGFRKVREREGRLAFTRRSSRPENSRLIRG